MTAISVWDRLHGQFKPDGKGRFKTVHAIAIAKQIDEERHILMARNKELESALRKCHTALEVAFDYDGDDVFGMMHNDAVDASMEAERLLGIK
jgi:hypothetical protein